VQQHYAHIVGTIDHLLDGWHDGQTVNMWDEMRKLSIRISTHIIFGDDDIERANALAGLIADWLDMTFSAGVWLFPFRLPGSPYHGLLKQAEQIERALKDKIASQHNRGQTDSVFSVLVNAHRESLAQMTDTDLLSQSTTMFAASYETVASTLTWTLFLLSQHPQVMADLHDEVTETLGGAPPTPGQLDRLPLLDAVIKEAMRVIPPVPLLVRTVCERAEVAGITMLGGDHVVCSPYLTHHLPDLYKDPQYFRPERWFQIDPGPYEYIPFGAGPRACLGYTLAMAELRTVVAMLAQRWKLTVVPHSHIDQTIRVMMRPKQGVSMSIHTPDGKYQAVPVRGNVHQLVNLDAAMQWQSNV
jgi:cytochrome P450